MGFRSLKQRRLSPLKSIMKRRAFHVSLPGLPFEVWCYRKRSSRSPHRGWRMRAIVQTTNSEPPYEVDYYGRDLSIEFYSRKITRKKIAAFALGLLLETFEHEVREKMTIDGKRAFPNPHAKKPR